MKISELLTKLDMTKANEDWVDLDSIAQRYMDIYHLPYVAEHELKAYWLGKHLCTDTDVGYRVYFLRGELIAISCQTARKSDEVFYWVGLDEFKKLQQYVLSLTETPEINLLDLDEEMPDMYSLGGNPSPWHINKGE